MRRLFWILVSVLIALGALAAWEFPNYLRKPSLRSHVFEDIGCRVDVFFDGVRPREAALFFRGGGREVLLDVLSDDGVTLAGEDFGSLRWTRDGCALVATELMAGGIESTKPLWVFDLTGLVPVPAEERETVIQERGGLGDRVFSWFELGRPGSYLFTWQANGWREQKRMLMGAGG